MTVVLLDLDNTILNTDKNLKRLYRVLDKSGLLEDFLKIYQDSKSIFGYANINFVLKQLTPALKKQGLSKARVISIITTINLIPHSQELLRFLIGRELKCYIFTDGNKNIQQEKIKKLQKQLGLNNLKAIIKKNKAEKIIQIIKQYGFQQQSLIVIDDKLKVLQTIKKKTAKHKLKLYCIWHCFGRHNQDYLENKPADNKVVEQTGIKPFFSLREILNYLKTLVEVPGLEPGSEKAL